MSRAALTPSLQVDLRQAVLNLIAETEMTMYSMTGVFEGVQLFLLQLLVLSTPSPPLFPLFPLLSIPPLAPASLLLQLTPISSHGMIVQVPPDERDKVFVFHVVSSSFAPSQSHMTVDGNVSFLATFAGCGRETITFVVR